MRPLLAATVAALLLVTGCASDDDPEPPPATPQAPASTGSPTGPASPDPAT